MSCCIIIIQNQIADFGPTTSSPFTQTRPWHHLQSNIRNSSGCTQIRAWPFPTIIMKPQTLAVHHDRYFFNQCWGVPAACHQQSNAALRCRTLAIVFSLVPVCCIGLLSDYIYVHRLAYSATSWFSGKLPPPLLRGISAQNRNSTQTNTLMLTWDVCG